MFQCLYEDNVSGKGKMSDARYTKINGNYEQEQAELTQTIQTLRASLIQVEEVNSGIRRFIQLSKQVS
ncbi:MAG: hypothetical protein LBI13_00610 [Streptococcaceae bacterium]|nr:hypothetical protein [Streptococcaceae bacterium]